jgi:hypothetical protein
MKKSLGLPVYSIMFYPIIAVPSDPVQDFSTLLNPPIYKLNESAFNDKALGDYDLQNNNLPHHIPVVTYTMVRVLSNRSETKFHLLTDLFSQNENVSSNRLNF